MNSAEVNRRRVAEYRERQRAAGRRQLQYYLTDDEKRAVDQFLKSLRSS